MNKILVFIVFFFSSSAWSDDFFNSDYDDQLSKKSGSEYLYINVAADIKRLKLDTVTYYFTSSAPNEVLYDSFKEFSQNIGMKDGAVYIPLNDKALGLFKRKKHKQDIMYKFAKISNCDFSHVTTGSILFEIRNSSLNKKDNCILFPVKDNALWLTSLLKKLNANINILKNNPNLSKLKKDSVTAILMNGIDVTFDKGMLEKNKTSIRRLIEWLGSFL